MSGETLLDDCIVDQLAALMPGAAGVEFRETLIRATGPLLADLACEGTSRQSLGFALHSLRGMCANAGFRAAAERAGVLQLAALESGPAGGLPAGAAAELGRLIDASLEALQERLRVQAA